MAGYSLESWVKPKQDINYVKRTCSKRGLDHGDFEVIQSLYLNYAGSKYIVSFLVEEKHKQTFKWIICAITCLFPCVDRSSNGAGSNIAPPSTNRIQYWIHFFASLEVRTELDSLLILLPPTKGRACFLMEVRTEWIHPCSSFHQSKFGTVLRVPSFCWWKSNRTGSTLAPSFINRILEFNSLLEVQTELDSPLLLLPPIKFWDWPYLILLRKVCKELDSSIASHSINRIFGWSYLLPPADWAGFRLPLEL